MGKGGENMKFEIPTIIEYSVDELNELTASSMHYEIVKEDYIPVEA